MAFFSYGMTKCGSTLAFELARTALERAGAEQPLMPAHLVDRPRRINFAPDIDADIGAWLRETGARLGHPVVVKTHKRPTPTVVEMVERGEAHAHAVFRDLRDMALSMLDHGHRARAAGRAAFAEIETLEDAMAGIDNQLDSLSAWLQLPGVHRLQYDELAFDTPRAAARILDQLALPGDPERIAAEVLGGRFTQKNKGLPDRHRTEMAPADSARFLDRYAPFYAELHGRPDPGRPLPPGTTLHTGAAPLDTAATAR